MGSAARSSFSLFSKIVVLFLIVLLPLLVIGLMINEKGKANLREELSGSLEERLDFSMDTLDAEFERIRKVQRELMLNKDVQRLQLAGALLTKYDLSQRILATQQQLYMLMNTSSLIRNAVLFVPSIDRVINSAYSIDVMREEEYERIASMKDQRQAIVERDGRLFIDSAFPDLIYYGKEPSYISSIELNTAAIRETLALSHPMGQGFAVLQSATEGWIMTSRSGLLTEKERELLPHIAATAEPPSDRVVEIEGEEYWTAYEQSAKTGLAMTVYVPESELVGKLQSYENWMRALAITSIAIILVYSAWMYRMIHQPMSQLVSSLRKVEKGLLEKMPALRRRDEFSYLHRQYNAMVEQLKVLIHQVYEQKIRNQSSELKQLQSQINPHFLYNTYFVMYRLAKMNETEKIVQICKHLGDYFQYITRNSTDDCVPLSDEIAHSRTYVEIQQIRFSNRIAVEFDFLPEAYANVPVPKLIVQPVLENAYKYGMESVQENGRIRISFEPAGDMLYVHVEENGKGMTDAELDDLRGKMGRTMGEVETTGLINVHRRLKLSCGDRCGIAFGHLPEGGLRVTLMIALPPNKS